MQEDLLKLKNNALSLILEIADAQELEQIRIKYLGRNGEITKILKEIPKLAQDKRAEAGRSANEIKTIIEDALANKLSTLNTQHATHRSLIDVTEPGVRPPLGHLHLVTQAIREITTIFERIGFTRKRYPEVEWDWYAFTALNFPDNHPARDDWETFFIKQKPDQKKGPVILTPHTSSGQVREMLNVVKSASGGKRANTSVIPAKAEIQNKNDWIPDQVEDDKDISIRMLNIAKCYRRQSDVSHTQMFHQFEGLVVGEKIAITHLKGTLDYFVKSYFGEKRTARIRPYHFQFTEPSFEVDVTCDVCLGKGCKLCKEGWLELGGAGMVHPTVLKHGGIDPKKYTGFAFGWGVERVLMMKEGIKIDDLRILYNNDLDFLKQF